ncbi:hypothetical protein ONZ45_g5863 [Pleurotus djamor]|nr:hypothetical protein ONZ45_g5863 [Pleurotus djamor]
MAQPYQPSAASTLQGLLLSLPDGLAFKLDDVIHQRSVDGRHSLSIRALRHPMPHIPDPLVVAKFNWVTTTSDCVLPVKLVPQDQQFPGVLYCGIIPDSESIYTRIVDGNSVDEDIDVDKVKPVLKVTVFGAPSPFRKLPAYSVKAFMKAIYDTFKCHKWVYETAGIVHGDVASNNLLYRLTWEGGNGILGGVLVQNDDALSKDEYTYQARAQFVALVKGLGLRGDAVREIDDALFKQGPPKAM